MREERAEQVAQLLNQTDRWHSHARGIPMSVLREEFKLRIADFGEQPDLNGAIRAYYRLLSDYVARSSHSAMTHTRHGYVHVM